MSLYFSIERALKEGRYQKYHWVGRAQWQVLCIHQHQANQTYRQGQFSWRDNWDKKNHRTLLCSGKIGLHIQVNDNWEMLHCWMTVGEKNITYLTSGEHIFPIKLEIWQNTGVTVSWFLSVHLCTFKLANDVVNPSPSSVFSILLSTML